MFSCTKKGRVINERDAEYNYYLDVTFKMNVSKSCIFSPVIKFEYKYHHGGLYEGSKLMGSGGQRRRRTVPFSTKAIMDHFEMFIEEVINEVEKKESVLVSCDIQVSGSPRYKIKYSSVAELKSKSLEAKSQLLKLAPDYADPDQNLGDCKDMRYV